MLNLMVGELNASHSGVGGPGGGAGPITGRIGVRFDKAEYDASGRLKVASVVPLGAAAVAGVGAGQYLVSVDGQKLDARTNLDELLANTIGKRVALGLSSSADGRDARDIAVRPTNAQTEKALLYREWVEEPALEEMLAGCGIARRHSQPLVELDDPQIPEEVRLPFCFLNQFPIQPRR